MYFPVPPPPAGSLGRWREAAIRRWLRFRCNGRSMARRLALACAPRRVRHPRAQPLWPLIVRHRGALTRFAGSSRTACAAENSVPSGIDFEFPAEPIERFGDHRIRIPDAWHQNGSAVTCRTAACRALSAIPAGGMTSRVSTLSRAPDHRCRRRVHDWRAPSQARGVSLHVVRPIGAWRARGARQNDPTGAIRRLPFTAAMVLISAVLPDRR
jgi:hypothetical protein